MWINHLKNVGSKLIFLFISVLEFWQLVPASNKVGEPTVWHGIPVLSAKALVVHSLGGGA